MVFAATFPSRNTTLIRDGIPRDLGGPAFNIAWYLRQLGWAVALVSPIGTLDRTLFESLLTSVNLPSHLLVSAPGNTDILFSILTANDNHLSVYFRSRLPRYIQTQLISNALKTDALVLAGGRQKIIRGAFTTLALSRKTRIIAFNPSYAIYEYAPHELLPLLTAAEVVILNASEARYTLHALGLSSFTRLARLVSGILVLTAGARGATVYQGASKLHLPTRARTVSSPIGAGDAFLAGFLDSLLRGQSIVAAGRFASALAARVVKSYKVRIHLSSPPRHSAN